jgi:cytochrome P450 family 1 subfamily D
VGRAFERIDGIIDEIVDLAAGREMPSSPGEQTDGDSFIHVMLPLQQKDAAPVGRQQSGGASAGTV